MNNLVLLTNSFPYEGGEQFLESEIQYWENTKFDNVYIVPLQIEGSRRTVPLRINIIEPVIEKSKVIYVFLGITNSLYYKELIYIIRSNHFKNIFFNFKSALKTIAIVLRIKNALEKSFNSLDGDITVYSYWNDYSFYAACLLKKEGLVKNVISRAHRYDIYENMRVNSYMPLKRQFMQDIDKVYLLSKNALNYYSITYGADSKFLDVGRLGVNIPLKNYETKAIEGRISILSLSYCTAIKQIDKIMLAVEEYAKSNSHLDIEWTHIGSGPLYEDLKNKADKLNSKYRNLHISFIGSLENKEVIRILEKKYFDVFINASKSEGIPVSIMEAMSYGIPAIAPNVGEISDLVNDSNGYLLSNNFTVNDIVNGINSILKDSQSSYYRKNAKSWVEKYFNANLNYPLFVEQVEKVAGVHDSQ